MKNKSDIPKNCDFLFSIIIAANLPYGLRTMFFLLIFWPFDHSRVYGYWSSCQHKKNCAVFSVDSSFFCRIQLSIGSVGTRLSFRALLRHVTIAFHRSKLCHCEFRAIGVIMITPVIFIKIKDVVFKTFYIQTPCSIVEDKQHRASIPVRALELSNRLLTMYQNSHSPSNRDKE